MYSLSVHFLKLKTRFTDDCSCGEKLRFCRARQYLYPRNPDKPSSSYWRGENPTAEPRSVEWYFDCITHRRIHYPRRRRCNLAETAENTTVRNGYEWEADARRNSVQGATFRWGEGGRNCLQRFEATGPADFVTYTDARVASSSTGRIRLARVRTRKGDSRAP